MRSLWTGSIGFGLVNIPVKLYSAVQASELDLDMIDKYDHAPIQYKRVNKNTGKEVEWADIVKAYSLDGDYVVLDDDDFAAAMPEKTKRIEIFQFVDEGDIESIYYESCYYLEPEKSGAKPYALLREALQKTGRAGVGSFVLRNKEHLAVIKPYGDVIMLSGIRFAEEIRDTEVLNIPAKSTVKPAELKMAMQLIDGMTEAFDIAAYKDTYTEQLLKLIKAKAKGVKTKVPKMKVVHKADADIMAMLKASLTGMGKRKRSA